MRSLNSTAAADFRGFPPSEKRKEYCIHCEKQIVIGVLALQGAFQKHVDAFEGLQSNIALRILQVKSPQDLALVDALVIPGGESTSMRILAGKDMMQALRHFARDQRKPVWGTCAGCILLSEAVVSFVNPSDTGCFTTKVAPILDYHTHSSSNNQHSSDGYGDFIGGAKVEVCRNFFGRQVDSFESPLRCEGRLTRVSEGMPAICIRAPAILRVLSNEVEILARIQLPKLVHGYSNVIAAVAQKNLLLTIFHPELTNDRRLHAFFLQQFVIPAVNPVAVVETSLLSGLQKEKDRDGNFQEKDKFQRLSSQCMQDSVLVGGI